MSEFYWNLVLKDGSTIQIPPSLVAVIKRRIANREAINMRSRMVLYAEIERFEQTSRLFTARPLLEEVAQVFSEPMLTEDGDIQTRWVKKQVTPGEYAKKYTHGYKRLPDEDGMVVVAFRKAIHDVDITTTPYLTETEVRQIESNT